MTVYVDDVRLRFGRMTMCHMWAGRIDAAGTYVLALDELLAMADAIGVQRRWVQQPPKADWVHFDISLGKKILALRHGAVLTDRFAAAEHTAKLSGNQKMLDMIASCRARRLHPQQEGKQP